MSVDNKLGEVLDIEDPSESGVGGIKENIEHPFNFDLKLMKDAVDSPRVLMPKGLSREEKRDFLSGEVVPKINNLEDLNAWLSPHPSKASEQELNYLMAIVEGWEVVGFKCDKVIAKTGFSSIGEEEDVFLYYPCKRNSPSACILRDKYKVSINYMLNYVSIQVENTLHKVRFGEKYFRKEVQPAVIECILRSVRKGGNYD